MHTKVHTKPHARECALSPESERPSLDAAATETAEHAPSLLTAAPDTGERRAHTRAHQGER
eukprot:5136193-Pleurochrysis_carterae.AAC.1